MVALALMGGLLADAAWQGLRAVRAGGRGAARLAERTTWIGSGMIHLGLAIAVLRLAAGAREADAEPRVRWWARFTMSAPYGDWVLGAAALVIIAIALVMIHRAWSGGADDALDPDAMSPAARRLTFALGRVGLATRAVTCALVGGFLLLAALQHDPAEARGIAGTVRGIRYDAYGQAVLGLLAVGFIANGIAELVRARFRRARVV